MIHKRSRPSPRSQRERADILGDEPESLREDVESMAPLPKRRSTSEGEQLIQQPGAPKPEEADAFGEGDVEELAQETEEEVLQERTRQAQIERPRTKLRESPPDIRRRSRETRSKKKSRR
jgi:hypothetical protein